MNIAVKDKKLQKRLIRKNYDLLGKTEFPGDAALISDDFRQAIHLIINARECLERAAANVAWISVGWWA